MVRTFSLLLLVLGIWAVAHAEEWIGGPDWYVQTALDNQGNLHVVFVDPSMEVFHKKYDGSTWTDSVYLANSTCCWLLYTYPAIDIGPDGLPHIVYGTDTGYYPHDLNYFTYAHAVNHACTSWTYQTIGNDGLRRGMADIAVDDSNQPHIVYQTTNKYSPWWYRITYRDPGGTEHIIREVWDPQQVVRPRIAYGNGKVHITWFETGSNRTNIWYAASPNFTPQRVSNVSYGHYAESPGIAVAPDGTVGIVYLVANWNGSPYYIGLFYTQPGWTDGTQLTGAAALNEYWEDFWPPNIAYHANGDRYISWYHWAENEHYYMGPSGTTVFYTKGHIDVCAGTAGAFYVRCAGDPGPMYFDQIVGGGTVYFPPTSTIDDITPNPVQRGVHFMVSFFGTAYDNDEGGQSIVVHEWTSDLDGEIGTSEGFSMLPINLQPGQHTISYRVLDDEGEWSAADYATLAVLADAIPPSPVTQIAIQHDGEDTLVITWGGVTDNLAMSRYDVYRATEAWFARVTLVDQVDATVFPLVMTDGTAFVQEDQAYYLIVPVDVDGNMNWSGARAGAYRYSSESAATR